MPSWPYTNTHRTKPVLTLHLYYLNTHRTKHILTLYFLYPNTAPSSHILILTQLGQLPRLQHIFVELVIVADREHHLVEKLQLLYVVGRHIPELYAAPVEMTKGVNVRYLTCNRG